MFGLAGKSDVLKVEKKGDVSAVMILASLNLKSTDESQVPKTTVGATA